MSFLKTNTVDIEVDGKIYNSLRDFGLAIGNTDYLKAPVQDDSHLVYVPGRDGPLDFSDAVFGGTVFLYRKIEIEFGGMRKPDQWDQMISDFRNLFEGKIVKLRFYTDPEWYWTGKAKIDAFEHQRSLGTFNFLIPYADPYKHRKRFLKVVSSSTGKTVKLFNARQKCIPTITTNAGISVTCGTNTVSITAGTWKFTALQLDQGETEWTIRGNATVTIEYTEGSL